MSRWQSVGAQQQLAHGWVEGSSLAGQDRRGRAEGIGRWRYAWSRKKADKKQGQETYKQINRASEVTHLVLRGAHANVVQTLARSAGHLKHVRLVHIKGGKALF